MRQWGVLVSSIAVAVPALAQEELTEAPQTTQQGEGEQSLLAAPSRPISYSLTTRGEFAYPTELDDRTQGDLYVTRTSVLLEASIPADERGQINIGFGSEWSNYEWDDGLLFGFTGDPFDDVYIHRLSAGYSRQQNANWSWFAGGSIQTAHETGTEFYNTIAGGVSGGAIYAVNPDLRLGLGASVSTQLEDGITAFPFPIIWWRPHERWTIETKAAGFVGGGAQVSYAVNDELSLTLDASYQQREFRLDNEDQLPDGVGFDRTIPVAFGALWKPQPNIKVHGRVGVQAYQEIELQDRNGNEIINTETNATPVFSLSLQWDF